MHVVEGMLILFEAAEANKVVVLKDLAFLSLLLHGDIFDGQRMDIKSLRKCEHRQGLRHSDSTCYRGEYLHFLVGRREDVEPEVALLHGVSELIGMGRYIRDGACMDRGWFCDRVKCDAAGVGCSYFDVGMLWLRNEAY